MMIAIAGGIILALFVLGLFRLGAELFIENDGTRGCGCAILIVATVIIVAILL